MRWLILFFKCLMVAGFSSSCQSQSIDGVYGGVKISLGMLGGGMDRDDIVFYLRKDGTFTDELDKPDWKTAVMGNYVVKDKEILLIYAKSKDTTSYDISPKGYLLAGGQYPLFRMHSNKDVPAGSFKFTGGRGGGGGISGIPYVGAFSQSNIHFDGKGNFSHSRFSTVSVSGDHIGGGSTSSKNDGGTYSYKEGVLS